MRFLLFFIFSVVCQPALAQIEISSGFERKAGVPLDVDAVKADLTERDAIPALIRYEGMLVYVESEGVNFQLVGGIDNTDWVEVGSGGGDVVGPSESTNNAITLFDGITGKLLKESALQIADEPGESTLTTPDGESGTSITIKASNSTEDEPAGDVKLEAGTSVNSIYDGAITFITGAATRLKILATGVIEVAQGSMLNFIDSGLNYVGIRGPTSASESYTLTLPADPPTNGKALVADETGQLEWGEAGGSGSGFGGKNYFVDPFYNRTLNHVAIYQNQLAVQVTSSSGLVTEGTNTINITSHGFRDRNKILYVNLGTVIGGLTDAQSYFVKYVDADSFQLSLTEDGPAVDLTSDGSGGQRFVRYYDNGISDGSPGLGFTLAIETTNPVANDGSLRLTKVASQNAYGNAIVFDTKKIDLEDRGKTLPFRFYFNVSSNYGTFKFYVRVWDVVNARELFVTGGDIVTGVQDVIGKVSTFSNTEEIIFSLWCEDMSGTGGGSSSYLGPLYLGPDSLVPGDSIQVEYAVNTSGITAAGASDTSAFLTGGPGSTAEAGVAIGNINSMTVTGNSATQFQVAFSDDIVPGDQLTLEVKGEGNTSWVVVGSGAVLAIMPQVGQGTARYGVGISTNNLASNRVSINFGNAGAVTTNTTYAAAGGPWSAVSAWRWRVKRTRVIKNTFSTTELMNKGAQVVATKSAGSHNSSGSWLDVTWTESRDVLGEFDGTTYTAKEPGLRILIGTLKFAVSATGERIVRAVNSSGTVISDGGGVVGSSTLQARLPFAIPVYLEAGGTVKIQAFQNSGGSLSYETSGTSLGIYTVFDPTVFSVYGEHKVAYIKDIKGSSTDGGTFTGGSWQTRTLNTIQGDSSFVSLSSNDFTLAPGQYLVKFVAPGYRVGVHKARLVEASNATERIVGSSAYSQSSTDYAVTDSHGFGLLTVSQATAFRLQHYGSSTQSSNGFGVASSSGSSEVYAQVEIQKIK